MPPEKPLLRRSHPCEQVPEESRDSGSRVIEHAAMRAAELFEMAEDPDFLGI